MTAHILRFTRSDILATARRVRQDAMVRNSIAIMSSTVLTSILGYAFWMVVARSFGTEASGTAAATTSAIQATVLLTSVGAAVGMVEWLPRCRTSLEWRQRVTTGIVVAAVTAAGGGALVVGTLGFASSALPQLATPAGSILFCAACVFFAVGVVLDYIAMSEHRGGILLGRNMALCGLRIPLIFIPVAALSEADQILWSWTVAAALSLVSAMIGFGFNSGRSLRPDFHKLQQHLRQMASALAGQHLITVSAMLAGYILPIVVYARLSPTQTSYFYITWMLGSMFFIISPAVSMALFVEGVANPSVLRQLVRRCFLVVGVLLTIPMVTYLLGGGLILSLFGSDYATHGHILLVLLTLSAIPDAVTNIAVSVLRATDRVASALALNAAMLVACVLSSWIVLPYAGIAGVGICWLVSQSIGALGVAVWWRRIIHVGGGESPSSQPLTWRRQQRKEPCIEGAAGQ